MLLLLIACLQEPAEPQAERAVSPTSEATPGDWTPVVPQDPEPEPLPVTSPEPASAEKPEGDPFGGVDLGVAPELLASLPPDSHGEPVLYAPDGGDPSGLSVALTRTVPVTGVPCSGRLMVDGGGFAVCKLGRDHRFGELLVRRGAQVGFWFDLEAGSASIRQLTFFDIEPPRQHLGVGGIPCENAATLHRDGSLARCMLGRESRVGGVSLPAGVDVFLDSSGALTQVVSYDTLSVAGAEYAPGTLVFKDGKVAGARAGSF
ncbi:MAG: hypothetical protein VX899_09095 [Myxococcota bacterium]|nr:hypothetical protein [Myxococcota bacterium]